MKLIEKLSDMIEEELNDADKYIECALYHKLDRPSLAATFFKISQEEMMHVNYLHDQVKQLIAEYRKDNGDAPKEMQFLYDYLHKKQIEKATQIQVKQAMFKQ